MLKGRIQGVGPVLDQVKAYPPTVRHALQPRLMDLVLAVEQRTRMDLVAQGLAAMVDDLMHRFSVRGTRTVAQVVESGRAAAYQEFGYHGAMTVADQVREIRQAFGHTIAPRAVAVAAHTRTVDYAGRPYLGPALSGLQGQLEAVALDAARAAAS